MKSLINANIARDSSLQVLILNSTSKYTQAMVQESSINALLRIAINSTSILAHSRSTSKCSIPSNMIPSRMITLVKSKIWETRYYLLTAPTRKGTKRRCYLNKWQGKRSFKDHKKMKWSKRALTRTSLNQITNNLQTCKWFKYHKVGNLLKLKVKVHY